jgi:N-sulfoglucosamine sulfohydrolase
MNKNPYLLKIAGHFGALLLAALSSGALHGSTQTITESFDWGQGVSGRETLRAGASIDGMPVLGYPLRWQVLHGSATLDGKPGAGNGELRMGPSRNSAVSLPVHLAGSGHVEVEAELRFGDTLPIRSLFIGFQPAVTDEVLLHNQKNDRIFLRLSDDGGIQMLSRRGELETIDRSNTVPFSNGDCVRLRLEVDAERNVVVGIVNNLTRGVESRASVPFYGNSDLATVAINQTGETGVIIHEFKLEGGFEQRVSNNTVPNSNRQLPNIIILMTDDMGQEMGVYGDPMNVTPHLDQLAAEGIRFNNAHVTAASCSPSRGSVFTGLFPHQHGMYSLSQFNWGRMHDDVPKLSVELNKLGYHTSIIGKTHFEPFDQFEWDVFINDGRKVNAERNVRWMNQQAMGILDSLPDGKPYFMVVSYIDPHRGGGAGREDPDVGIGRYAPGKNLIFPRIRSGLPENPPALEDTIPLPYLGVDSPEVRMEISDYYSAIMRLDTGIGEFLQALEERGDAEDTLVIFFGDHGADVTRGKMAVYASATRIPLVIRWPGQIAPGSVRDELVSTIDLFPTIMTAVGSDFSDPRQTGLPLQRLWQAGEAEWRTGLATQLITHVPWHYYPRYSWFEGDYHLIHNLHHERPGPLEGRNFCFAWWEVQKPEYDGTPIREVYDRVTHPPEFELYNLKEDPYEFVNLAYRPEYQVLVKKLHSRIQTWRENTSDPFLDPAYGEAYHKRVLKMQANHGR